MATEPATLTQLAALLEATFSHDAAIRGAAEAQLRVAEATPGFAPALLALARSPAAPPGTRQSAAVALKALVARRWAPDDDDDAHLAGPELPDDEKAAIKAGLLASLAEPDSKVRTALGMVTSRIYASDDEWGELLPALVAAVGGTAPGTDPASVAGAVRTLALIADDVSDEAALATAPLLLPAMRGLAGQAGADPGLRAQATDVAASLLGALATCRGGGGHASSSAVRKVVDPEVGPWLAAAAATLREPGRAWGLKLAALRLATRVSAAFPRPAAAAGPADVAAAVWAGLGAALPEYVRTAVGSGTPLDADGCGGSDEEEEEEEEGGGGGGDASPAARFVAQALEFFCLLAARAPGLPPSSLPDLLSACLVAMRAPRASRSAWAADADAFVGDEDDDAGGPRGAGEVLLATAVLGDDLDEAAGASLFTSGAAPSVSQDALAALAGAVRGALAEAEAGRAGRAPGWWLPREAALLAVGAVRDALAAPVPGLEPGAILAACLAADLPSNPPAASEAAAAAAGLAPPPLLAARALWLAARLAPLLDEAGVGAALAAAAAAASPASPPPVQAQAARAVAALAPRAARPALAAAAPAAAGGLVAILDGGALADRAAALGLDALTALATAGVAGAGPGGPAAAAGAALRAWGAATAAADPLVGPAAEDTVLALASAAPTSDATFEAALPTLAAVVREPARHGGTAVTAALHLLAGLMAVAPPGAAAAAHAAATPPALAIIAARGGGDPAACRAACEYVRALVRAGGHGLVAGPGALAALAGPLAGLVAPPPPGADAGEAADAAGRAAPALASLLRRAPPEAAAAAVREAALAAAARMASAATPPPLAAALVGLLARGVLADPAGMVAALAARPAPPDARPLPPGVPPPDPAAGLLAPALTAWFARAGEVVGAYEIAASTAALGRLALSPPHPALDRLAVPGAPVVEASASVIRTRSRARAAGPQAWTALPARAKALALLADAVLEEAEGLGPRGGGHSEEDDGWESASTDDENDENDTPSPAGRSSVAAALARGDGAAAFAARLGKFAGGLPGFDAGGDDDGEDGDADADADPDDPLATARPGALAAADLKRAAEVDAAGLAAAAGLLSAAQRAAVEAAVRG